LSQYGYKTNDTYFVPIVHALAYAISSSVDPDSLVAMPIYVEAIEVSYNVSQVEAIEESKQA
jgi:hypothetical protein